MKIRRILYCREDPRVPEFYHRRRALAEVTAKLRSRGEEKKGLSVNALVAVEKKLSWYIELMNIPDDLKYGKLYIGQQIFEIARVDSLIRKPNEKRKRWDSGVEVQLGGCLFILGHSSTGLRRGLAQPFQGFSLTLRKKSERRHVEMRPKTVEWAVHFVLAQCSRFAVIKYRKLRDECEYGTLWGSIRSCVLDALVHRCRDNRKILDCIYEKWDPRSEIYKRNDDLRPEEIENNKIAIEKYEPVTFNPGINLKDSLAKGFRLFCTHPTHPKPVHQMEPDENTDVEQICTVYVAGTGMNPEGNINAASGIWFSEDDQRNEAINVPDNLANEESGTLWNSTCPAKYDSKHKT
ncbi:hypothetical protein C8R44DRAFT_850878 [Mycena epipterygia]|nr:hypothetical protein C8R44DRAFT_850878 [Mycena epipterygia]